MAVSLSPEQEAAVKVFLDLVRGDSAGESEGEGESDGGEAAGAVARAAAARFLWARKWDVARALALWRAHEETRAREGLADLRPLDEPLKSELTTGKFTVLSTRDPTGAAIAIFTAHKHFPTLTSHQTTLQGLVYQLDAALHSAQTQRAGLVFIYDMTLSKYANFDYELSHKILALLKGGYPAKLKKVLIVTAPLWFKAPFRILRLFVREKLRERVYTVSCPQLRAHLPRAAIPTHLGGGAKHDHAVWLEHCRTCVNTESAEYVISNQCMHFKVEMTAEEGGGGVEDGASRNHSPLRNGDASNLNNSPDDMSMSGRTTSMCCSDADQSSGFSDEEGVCGGGGMTPHQLAAHVRALGRRGLLAEYDEIRAVPPAGTFNHSRLRANQCKNRYTDVLCYDHTRVALTQTDRPDSDYINANFVHSYKRHNAYICTQGPLPGTFGDFWRMVWEQNVRTVVMTTRTEERRRTKCGQYWGAEPGQAVACGELRAHTHSVTCAENGDYVVTDITLTHTKTGEERELRHWQYVAWPDYGVPSADRLIFFLQALRSHVREDEGPVVVHCSAGIGRTGTLLTLDICSLRLDAEGVADVRGTVLAIRAQRAHSIQTPQQYIFCHLALLHYAVMQGYLPAEELVTLDSEPDSDED